MAEIFHGTLWIKTTTNHEIRLMQPILFTTNPKLNPYWYGNLYLNKIMKRVISYQKISSWTTCLFCINRQSPETCWNSLISRQTFPKLLQPPGGIKINWREETRNIWIRNGQRDVTSFQFNLIVNILPYKCSSKVGERWGNKWGWTAKLLKKGRKAMSFTCFAHCF